jgi:hypothetical protein
MFDDAMARRESPTMLGQVKASCKLLNGCSGWGFSGFSEQECELTLTGDVLLLKPHRDAPIAFLLQDADITQHGRDILLMLKELDIFSLRFSSFHQAKWWVAQLRCAKHLWWQVLSTSRVATWRMRSDSETEPLDLEVDLLESEGNQDKCNLQPKPDCSDAQTSLPEKILAAVSTSLSTAMVKKMSEDKFTDVDRTQRIKAFGNVVGVDVPLNMMPDWSPSCTPQPYRPFRSHRPHMVKDHKEWEEREFLAHVRMAKIAANHQRMRRLASNLCPLVC